MLLHFIIKQFVEIQSGKLWVGSNYSRKLEGINAENAFVRPHPHLHSVAEIINHLTVWRKDAISKIGLGKGLLLDDSPTNWLSNEELKQKGWQNILHEYHASVHELIELLETKNDAFLDDKYYDVDFRGEYPYSFAIEGLLHHDLYHLGQLGIIIKFLNNKTLQQ